LKRARTKLGVVAEKRGGKWFSGLPRIVLQGGQDSAPEGRGSEDGQQEGHIQDLASLDDFESEEANGVGPLANRAPRQGGQGPTRPPSVPAPRVRCLGGCGTMVPPGQKCVPCAADAVRARDSKPEAAV
jgi:hypothetical protein